MLWLQRVLSASVTVDGEVVGSIDGGLLVLLGVTHTDTEAEAAWMARKIRDVRILRDEQSVGDVAHRSCSSASSRCTATRARVAVPRGRPRLPVP